MDWNYLGPIFSSPATDLSYYITSTVPISIAVANDITDQYQEALDDAIQDIAIAQAAEVIGLDNIVINGAQLTNVTNGNKYYYTENNGIPNIKEITSGQVKDSGTTGKVIFDVTDQEDYNNRYTSLDALKRNNDVSDVAFFNIIKNDSTKDNVVFPDYQQNTYPQPGITKNKFRQFILMQMSEPSQEKMQLVENSEDFQVLFYGKKPEILSIAGILKNTKDNPWSTNMLFVWSELMRGTKLVENGWIFQLYVDGELFRGYPFNFNRTKMAPGDFLVNFSMNLVIKERINIYNTTVTLETSAMEATEAYQASQGNIL